MLAGKIFASNFRVHPFSWITHTNITHDNYKLTLTVSELFKNDLGKIQF